MIPGDGAPGGGGRLSALLTILITRFSSSEFRLGSPSVYAKFTNVTAGFSPDAFLVCVLSKVSSTLGLGVVLMAS